MNSPGPAFCESPEKPLKCAPKNGRIERKFTKVCEHLVEEGKKDPIFKDSVNWLLKKSEEEWYQDPKKAEEYISESKVKKSLLEEETFLKLNTGFFARICLNKTQYDSYYKVLKRVLTNFVSKEEMKIVSQILLLCKERNYFMKCKYGNIENPRFLSLNLLPET